MSLRLDWCSHEAARYACEHWYSRSEMPVGKLVKIGVWEDGQFVGVLIFGCGTGGVAKIGERLGAGPFGTAELSRIALKSHSVEVSRIISIACKILHRAQPGLRLLLTYADPSTGHHGGIYQGAGWTYIGKSAPDSMYRDTAGNIHHSRQVSASGWKMSRGKVVTVTNKMQCERIRLEPKHRYALGLDAEMRDKLETIRQAYPKRVRSDLADTPAVQAGEGDAISTRTLQSDIGDSPQIGPPQKPLK
jgi:hypothetical protein